MDFPLMKMNIRIVMHMLTGTKLLMVMQFIMLMGTTTTGLPQCRGFETALSETNDVVAFGMKKKLKTIFVGVSC